MGSYLSTRCEETFQTKDSIDLCFPQDNCGLNVCQEGQIDLADITSLVDENQDTDPHNFTNDQSKVQSDDVESLLIGDHETQESEGGEADLHRHGGDCKKNPGHSQFIPVDTFTLKHLPKGYQDKDLYEYIKIIADETVRVDVKMTSPYRPKIYPKTTQPYPFYNMSERRSLRTGSGRVWYVNKFQDGVIQDKVEQVSLIGGTDYTKCWCRKCEDSDSPNNVWWEFVVTTANHVVFDDIEANHTTLRLFYDKDESPVVIVDKVSVVLVDIDYDWCLLKCVTCDRNVGTKLMEMDTNLNYVMNKVWNKYWDYRPKHKFTFIVSHPHGCFKQVSVGQWKDRQQVSERRCKLTYTTCTCPGSSGAHVQCLGYVNWTQSVLVHSGSSKSGFNYSGVG
ncbi:uncharacterized protein LOC106073955 [Biomphalaria glabrata]|uniref:Uncharacterized protein LOC106073955 n=1 Tax=Biomphalaria glabrata TaxID=6526 RepID=A0A9W3B6Y8_BIOGL|nr:uncharacterized protein LOC106073955 [Biomphalaria glabrata]